MSRTVVDPACIPHFIPLRDPDSCLARKMGCSLIDQGDARTFA